MATHRSAALSPANSHQAWRRGFTAKLSGRTKATELDTLLPWNWKPSGDLALAAAA
jgi:hypothetical protein